MSDRPGMEVTPVFAEGDEGDYIVDFHVDDGYQRHEQIEAFNYADPYYQTQDGEYHHQLENLDFEAFSNYYDPEFYDNTEYEQQYEQLGITEPDGQYLRDILGGDEATDEILSWAGSVYDDNILSDIQDTVMSGDIDLISELFQELRSAYYLNNSDSEYYDEDYVEYEQEPEEEYIQDEIDTDSIMEELGGYDYYQNAVSWAKDNLDAEFIHAYDKCMEGNNEQHIRILSKHLVDLYAEWN